MKKRHNFVLEKYGKLQSHCFTNPDDSNDFGSKNNSGHSISDNNDTCDNVRNNDNACHDVSEITTTQFI